LLFFFVLELAWLHLFYLASWFFRYQVSGALNCYRNSFGHGDAVTRDGRIAGNNFMVQEFAHSHGITSKNVHAVYTALVWTTYSNAGTAACFFVGLVWLTALLLTVGWHFAWNWNFAESGYIFANQAGAEGLTFSMTLTELSP